MSRWEGLNLSFIVISYCQPAIPHSTIHFLGHNLKPPTSKCNQFTYSSYDYSLFLIIIFLYLPFCYYHYRGNDAPLAGSSLEYTVKSHFDAKFLRYIISFRWSDHCVIQACFLPQWRGSLSHLLLNLAILFAIPTTG